MIGEGGVPTLKRRRGAGTPQAAEDLAAAIARRMPERSLLSIVARTAYWLGWHHHFGPASGSDPKISDPHGRYCMAVFTGGVNIGPYEAAKHIAGVSARELSMVRNRHIDLKKLNAAIATVVNAFAGLDVVKAWGDGTAVAADGTQVETYIDNLLAESSIRYGGVGGIAYHYVSDTYVALFSRFIPCGVWEAVHLIEGLLANDSDIQPTTVHADTQGLVVTWTPLVPLASLAPGCNQSSGDRAGRMRRCLCGYGSSAVKTAPTGSTWSMRTVSRSRSCRGSCGSWRPGIARPTRWSPTPTTFVTCGGSSTVTA